MTLGKAWQKTAFWLGVGWSLVWSVILGNLPILQTLELNLQDRFIRIGHPSLPPQDIVLVTIDESDLKKWGVSQEQYFYADLVNRLVQEDAAVVILNLLPNWVQTSDHADHPIKELILKYHSKIVLAIPTSNLSQPNPTEWRNYEYFLPLNDRGDPIFPPKTILGFFEYEPEGKQPRSLASIARQANLSGNLTLSGNLNQVKNLQSFALLSLEKSRQEKQNRLLAQSPIQIHFWGATGTFERIPVAALTPQSQLFRQVRQKIVIVGFTNLNNPDTFPILSPFGDAMPAIEWQANLLASLMTHSYYRIVPWWSQEILIICGGILISQWVVLGMLKPKFRCKFRYWLLPWVIISSSGILSLFAFGNGLMLPVVLPLFVWSGTGLSILISMLLGVQKDLIEQQQCEISRLQSIEQEAVIAQARKFLHRLASNIHEGPLQELKLIMDELELLQLNHDSTKIESILTRLEEMGEQLRKHLYRTRTIALEITPELREGLDSGIEKKLQQLMHSGELQLKVIRKLQPLEEPPLNSLWLEAREEIFCFFCEAISNVIHHAQPPYGTATQVKIHLSQQQEQCTLSIENDGLEVHPQQKRGGYGLKLMETIATELPEGTMEKIILSDERVKIILMWKMMFNS